MLDPWLGMFEHPPVLLTSSLLFMSSSSMFFGLFFKYTVQNNQQCFIDGHSHRMEWPSFSSPYRPIAAACHSARHGINKVSKSINHSEIVSKPSIKKILSIWFSLQSVLLCADTFFICTASWEHPFYLDAASQHCRDGWIPGALWCYFRIETQSNITTSHVVICIWCYSPLSHSGQSLTR